jgi:hypothetical protein
VKEKKINGERDREGGGGFVQGKSKIRREKIRSSVEGGKRMKE